MKPVVALAGLVGLCTALAACGGSPPPPPQAAGPKPAAPAPAAPKPAAAGQPAPLVAVPAVPQVKGAEYDAKGRRDPFVSLEVTSGPKGLEVA